MNEQIIVEKLIEKFRFDEPVTPEIRNYISNSKKNNLKRILKSEHKYVFLPVQQLLFFF